MAGLPATYEFGEVRVDAASELVLRAGAPVVLEPKAFELLVYFIQHQGRLLDKQEILDAVWGQTFVGENALTRVVAQLRKALGDDAHKSKYIETVPRRGYRFVADVRTVGASETHAPRWKRLPILLGAALAVLVAVGAVIFFYDAGTEDVAWPELPIQVTSSDALDIFPTLSPDGNAVAFSSNRSGSFEIYVKQLTPAGELIQLTSDGFQNFQPAWSPRGDLIAYHSKNGGGIWTAPAFGGAPRKLTDFGSQPAWSPDGWWIAFQSSPLTDLGADAATLPPSTIWICALEGGSPRQLTKVDDVPGGHSSPAWSPAGERIAFGAGSRLWTVSLEGELELVLEKPPQYLNGVVYAPSGDKLYFTWHGELWSVDPTRADSAPQLLRRDVASAIRHPTFSADGKKFAYTEVVTSSNLASVPISATTNEPTGPPRPLTQYTNHRNIFPRFSPDGRTIAFARQLAGSASDVWLIDADGGNVRRLTTHPGFDNLPWWSADGKHVIFSTDREGDGSAFWSIDVDTAVESFLRSRPRHWSVPDLSRDAARIAFSAANDEGVFNIWVASISGDGEERQLTFDEELIAWPSWSPDGAYLALQIKRGADTRIGFIPAEGGTPEQLTNTPGQNWVGSWSPDGDKIAFASWRDGAWNLRWVSRTDKSECQLTDYTSLNTFVRYPTWSPLGDQIVYEYAETTGDIWLLELP